MNSFLDCIPCLLKQTLAAVRLATSDETAHRAVMNQALTLLAKQSLEETPPLLCRDLQNIVRSVSKNPDPYQEEKKYFNSLVLENIGHFERLIQESTQPLKTAAKLSIIGNVIDFGAYHHREEIDLFKDVNKHLQAPLGVDDFQALQKALRNAKKILFFGDNSGEIVLDTLLVKAIGPERVTYVVRGKPILNDATLSDANFCGMTDLCQVIDNGSSTPGTILESLSEELRQAFKDADVIIAKGQGNFETMCKLSHPNLFFLLMVKCPVLARDIGCHVNNMILKQQTQGG